MKTKEKMWFKRAGWIRSLLVVLLVGLVALTVGCADIASVTPSLVDSDQSQTDASSAAEKPAGAQTAYEIGEGTARIWKSSIGTQWISIAVPVKNTGSENLYLSSGTMDVEDASGALVTTMELVSVYPPVLQPGETAYYYHETTLDEDIAQEGLKIVPHVDVEKAKVDCVRYEISEVTVKDTDYYGAGVTGRVENTTDEAESMVYVVARLFDADDNLLAQQFTILTSELQPGEKIGFETTNLGYEVAAADVARYELFAFPLQYQF